MIKIKGKNRFRLKRDIFFNFQSSNLHVVSNNNKSGDDNEIEENLSKDQTEEYPANDILNEDEDYQPDEVK